MKTLTERCSEENFATPEAAGRSLAWARRFTGLFQKCADLPVEEREAALLALQFPAILQPPRVGDVFAGRVHYGCVGLSPEACGLGFYFDRTGLERARSTGMVDRRDDQAWDALAAFWSTRTTAARVRAAYPADVSGLLPSDAWTEVGGVAFPLYRLAGTVLDYGTLLALGLDGLEARVQQDSPWGRACRMALAVFRRSIDQCAAWSLDPEMRRALQGVRHAPPRTFREAAQLFWLWALHSGTWNYGRLDAVLGPWLVRDLQAGRLDRDQALEWVCSLWRLMHAYDNPYNNRVIIGGAGRGDEAAADQFALLAIEATRRLRLNQPQLSLRLAPGQDSQLWERAVEALGEGVTFPMLYNDAVNIPALARAFGVPEAQAVDYTPFGCGETVLGPRSVGTPSGVINLLKALEVALHGGRDPRDGCLRVPGIAPVTDLRDFESVWRAYAGVVEPHVAALARQQKIEYETTGREVSFLFISMLSGKCRERGRALLDGGAEHLGGTLEVYGGTNTADSLLAIEELVFRRRSVSLGALVAAMDAGFAGQDGLRARCRAVSKYGNDEALADAMACRVHRHICGAARGQAGPAGLDSYLVVVINNWANTVLGRTTGASADGRGDGQPMANGNNPSPGADRAGVTAFLNSLAKPEAGLHAGAVQNMKFSPEWFGTARPQFEALIRTYFARGGTQAMVTVVARGDLEAAMAHPEAWSHLMVRVGGFSIRFVDLPREAQREVLARTLHAAA